MFKDEAFSGLIAHHHTVLIFGLISIRPHIINFVLPTIMSIGVSWAILAEIVPSICVLHVYGIYNFDNLIRKN